MTDSSKPNKSNEHIAGLGRRDVIKGAAAGLVAATGTHPHVHAAETHTAGRDLIKRENANPGTRDWLLTKADITDIEPAALWRSPRIEGYCSATSVSAGDTQR